MTRAALIRWLPAVAMAAAAIAGAQPAPSPQAPAQSSSPSSSQSSSQPSSHISFVVGPELWDRPRSGGAVLAQPAVRQAIDSHLKTPGSRLVVRHGPTQESVLAAEELRAWLAALAVEPSRIGLRGGLQGSEPLRIEIVPE
jgi:hypothetical protein